MADHLLHFSPGPEGYGTWHLECNHGDGLPWFRDDRGNVLSACWTRDWWDNLGPETMTGTWPEDPQFPIGVTVEWVNDSMAVTYYGIGE